MRALLKAMALCLLPLASPAAEVSMQALETADASRGWEAVGRVNLGPKSFCTGTLIAPSLVLTAAHCLYDADSGAELDVAGFEFLAGWRNGRAAAYRGVRRAIKHPDYVYEGRERLDRVAFDLAFLELDQPIRLPSIQPFQTGADPQRGDHVGIVSYAHDRSELASLQQDCEVLGRQPGVLVLTCSVDFGSSGAPIFSMAGGRPQLVSVISAKAQLNGENVALATAMEQPLNELRAAYLASDSPFRRASSGGFSATGGSGAKFVTP